MLSADRREQTPEQKESVLEPSIGIGLIGLTVGFLVGMTGMGGGALTMPLLVYWVGVRPVTAVGTDLAFLAVLKAFGAWTHHQWGNVDWRLVRRLALGSIPGAVVGLLLLALLRSSSPALADAVIARLLGAVLIAVSLTIFARALPWTQRWSDRLLGGRDQPVEPSTATTLALGFVVGVLVTLTSVGGGTLIVAALVTLYRMNGRSIVGTDVAHALILTSVAAAGHVGIGRVDFLLAANLLVGAIPGVILGSRMTLKLPEHGLRAVLGSVLLVAGLRLI